MVIERSFMELLSARWGESKFVCVGLDSDVNSPKFPDRREFFTALSTSSAQLIFNQAIVDATKDLVCAYKPNLSFYRGARGKQILRQTIFYIHQHAPGVPVILDAKYGDIGSSNDGYVDEAFAYFSADAVTIHNYLGAEAMQPFLDQKNKGIIVLCRTSNPGAGEFQDIPVVLGHHADSGEAYWGPLYMQVAASVSNPNRWNGNGNCGLVVGATYPNELAEVRKAVGDMPILIPGIGAQGGDLEATVRAGKNSKGQGMIINNARSIIFASSGKDYAEAARAAAQKMHDDITAVLAA